MKRGHIAGMLLSVLLLTSCGGGSGYSRQTTDLTASLSGAEIAEGSAKTDAFTDAQYQVTLSMMQAGMRLHPAENQSLAPYLTAQTLMLAANGAEGATRTEIEALFGGMETAALTEYLTGWRRSQPEGQLVTAHSVWFRESAGLGVRQSYLNTLHSYFDAEAFTAAFDDSTLSDMKLWISNHTDGKITQLAEQLDANEVFDLFSAAVFDAQWENPYADNEVYTGLFYAADGTQQTVRYMAKEKDEAFYLADDHAVGVMRNYADRRYAFAALMPQDMTVQEYLEQLTPAQLQSLLGNQKTATIDCAIPEFTVDNPLDLRPLLQEMGVQTAYQAGSADFSGITEQALYLNRSMQQTVIQVDRHGTKATYSLDFSGDTKSAGDSYFVRLTKPFVWFVYDRQYGVPVMAGTVLTLQ